VLYSSNTTSVDLYAYTDSEDAKNKIKDMGKGKGKTDVKSGFDAVRNIFGNAAAVRGNGVPKVVVLVTVQRDDNTEVFNAADLVHDMGVNVAVVGIDNTNGFNATELEYFATDARTMSLLRVGEFNLSTIVHKILTETCKFPARIGNSTAAVSTVVYPSTTVNFEYLTTSEQYSLLIQVDGRVLIYMNYYPSQEVPTQYEYDLFYECDIECEVPVPVLPFAMANISRREVHPVPANKKVILSVKFMAKLGREDIPLNITMTRVPYNAAAVPTPIIVTAPVVPASEAEIEAGDLAFMTEMGLIEPKDDPEPEPTPTPLPIPLPIPVPNIDPIINDAPENSGSSSGANAYTFVGAVIGLASIVGVGAAVLVRRMREVVVEEPHLDTVVTTVHTDTEATPEVTESETIEPRVSAVKRLNSSRHLNELAK
jgi:hypothetical protein